MATAYARNMIAYYQIIPFHSCSSLNPSPSKSSVLAGQVIMTTSAIACFGTMIKAYANTIAEAKIIARLTDRVIRLCFVIATDLVLNSN